MNRMLLLSVTALMALGAGSASAQLKGPEGKGGAPIQGAPGGQPAQKGEAPAEPGAGKAEPKAQGDKGRAQTRDQQGKGSAQTEPKDKGTKGAAQKGAEPKDNATKGTAQKGMEPKDKASKGTAEKGREPTDKSAKGEAGKGHGNRVQLSEQQRTNVSQSLLKDSHVNRLTHANFSVNVGSRVPRSIRLVALPVSIVGIVPEYRPYRYVVIDEQICIVDPATYEIVEIITTSGRTAGAGSTRLVLTDEERTIILSETDMSGDSTLALGALTEGSDVPRGVQLRVFPNTVVQKVPKLRGYRFFASENRLAIVDPQGAKVQLVIAQRR